MEIYGIYLRICRRKCKKYVWNFLEWKILINKRIKNIKKIIIIIIIRKRYKNWFRRLWIIRLTILK